jgi:hypothetical protein
MAFDAAAFLSNPASLTGVAASFGVPSCLLTLAQDLMAFIPTPILLAIREAMLAGQRLADAFIKKLFTYIREKLGISLDLQRDGLFGFFSEYSRFGLDLISGITAAISAFMTVIQELLATAQMLQDQYDRIKSCLEEFQRYLDFKNGSAAQRREELAQSNPAEYAKLINSEFGVYLAEAEIAQNFLNQSQAQVEAINSIVSERILNPELEPGEPPTESVFRLEAGPPLSRSGKFILSVDGLYYDSQEEGAIPALLELEDRRGNLERPLGQNYNSDLWKLEFDPSIGGRGAPVTEESLKSYFDTILSPEIIDNSKPLIKYYDRDELLLSLEGQKDRRVYDLSGELMDLAASGESQAVLDNLKQVMLSESAQFQNMINKRKKQIEIAVKVPTFMGKGPAYTPGNVPVNDFSYLNGSNFLLELETQRDLVISQDDVTGVVLPLDTKYTEKIKTSEPVFLNHILVTNIATGEIVTDPGETSAIQLQINTRIVEDDLISLFNYLTVKATSVSSGNYGVHNSSKYGTAYNGQAIGTASSMFVSGLGIPYLEGVAKPASGNNEIVSSLGSFIRMPEVNEMKDLLYNRKGATFETWIHMPGLSSTDSYNMYDGDALGLYRLILANENTGSGDGREGDEDILNMDLDQGTGVVRGLVYGFTRDVRFTKNTNPTNVSDDNPVSALNLILAPTQSYDFSSVGFVAEKNPENCERLGWRGMKIPVFETFNGVSLSSCSGSFCQLSLTINPIKDQIKVYLDGVNLATSSYQKVFGTPLKKSVYKAPSVIQNNSFEYNSEKLNVSSVSEAKAGPNTDTFFTPWILGGGYTDGNPNGNFMGGEYGGKVSGLRGYLGCSRFYSRVLSEEDIVNNYNATKNFFKNIKV